MRATLIFNPAAGQREVRVQLRNVVGHLAERGWTVVWKETTPSLDATTLAREAVAEGAEVVIAAGGDGTINGVVNGLVGHPEVQLGILPTGTANVWARESGISSASLLGPNLEAAGEVLLQGTPVSMDVGRAGGRYFLLMAGIGFDAHVTRHLDLKMKRKVGALAYPWTALREAFKYRGARVRLIVDGEEIVRKAWMVTVSNSKLYALVPLAPHASVTDGLLDVGIFEGRNWLHIFRQLISIMLGRHTLDPEVEFFRGREIQIQAVPPLPIHVDAEPIGQTPMTFTVLPGALKVIMAPQMARALTNPPDEKKARGGPKRLRLDRQPSG